MNKVQYLKSVVIVLKCFFLKILNSIFESINMGLNRKLFRQLFVIVYFAVESEKGSVEISCNPRSVRFSYTSRQSSENPRLQLVYF